MKASPINSIYFPTMESPTTRSLDSEYCLCEDIICRAPQFWVSDTLLNMQFILESGDFFSVVQIVEANGAITPVAAILSTGPDGRGYVSVQDFDTTPWIGKTFCFRVIRNTSFTYDSWPVRVLASTDCSQELSKLTYSGDCVEQDVYWDVNGVLQMNYFAVTCSRSFDLETSLNSFVAGDGTLRVCSSDSQETWTVTYDFAPLGIIRKLSYISYTRNLDFNGATMVVQSALAKDLQYGNYQIYRSQMQMTLQEKVVHVSACCPE